MKSEFFKNEEASSKQATLFKFGITKNVEHRGEKVQVSGPSFAGEKPGIYSCICQKYFKTKAGLQKLAACKNSGWSKTKILTSGLEMVTRNLM